MAANDEKGTRTEATDYGRQTVGSYNKGYGKKYGGEGYSTSAAGLGALAKKLKEEKATPTPRPTPKAVADKKVSSK